MRKWIFILIFSTLFGNMNAHQIKLVTYHQKTNGVLIRVVVSNIPVVDNIAAWVGQENWFYLTLNGTYLSPSAVEYIEFEPPLMDIEIKNTKKPIEYIKAIRFLEERIDDFSY